MSTTILLQLLNSPPEEWPALGSDELREVMVWVDAHRIGPWLYRRLRGKNGAEQNPWFEVLKARYTLSLVQSALDDRVRREVLAALHGSGISVIPLKGAVLGPWLYGEAGIRPSNDLDVLIPPDWHGVAERVMVGLGYEPVIRKHSPWVEMSSHERAFWRHQDLPVELHRHVTQMRRFRLPLEDLLARAVPWQWNGLSLYRLDDEDQFLTLIIHAVHHQFLIPLISWLDLLALLERGVDLNLVAERARRCGGLPALRITAELLARYFRRTDLLAYAPRLPAWRKRCLQGICNGWPSLETSRGPYRDRWHAFWMMDRPRDATHFALDYGLRWLLDRPFAWEAHQSLRWRSKSGWRSNDLERARGNSEPVGSIASPQPLQKGWVPE